MAVQEKINNYFAKSTESGNLFSKMLNYWTNYKNKINPNERTSEENPSIKNSRNSPNSMVTDIYTALFPIYHLSKLLGILPVSFKKIDHRYIGNPTCLSIFYGLLMTAIMLSTQCWGLWRDLRQGWRNSTRLNSETAITVTCLDVSAVFILAASTVIGAPSRWKYLQSAMDKIVEVDMKLGMYNPKKLRIVSIVTTFIMMTYIISLSTMDYEAWKYSNSIKRPNASSDKGPINYAPIYAMYIVLTMFEIQYYLIAYNICIRFKRLNRTIEIQSKGKQIINYFVKDLALGHNANRNEQIVAFIKSDLGYHKDPKGAKDDNTMWPITENDEIQDNIAANISKLITLYGLLCDTIILLNHSYGTSLLIAVVSCLIHLIITPYFLYMEINDENHLWQTIAMQVLWCIFHVVRLLILVQPCYNTISEGKRTGVIVSQLLSSDWGPQVRKQLEIFSLQLLLRPMDFTANGLFSIDRTLVASIAGAVTTYLVILIQFQTVDDEQGTKYMLKNATQLLTSVKDNVSHLKEISGSTGK